MDEIKEVVMSKLLVNKSLGKWDNG